MLKYFVLQKVLNNILKSEIIKVSCLFVTILDASWNRIFFCFFTGRRHSGQTGPSPLGSEAAQGDEGLAAPSSTDPTATHVNCQQIMQYKLATFKCEVRGASPLGSKAAQGGKGLAAPILTLEAALIKTATRKTDTATGTTRHGAPLYFSVGVVRSVNSGAQVPV